MGVWGGRRFKDLFVYSFESQKCGEREQENEKERGKGGGENNLVPSPDGSMTRKEPG